MNGLNQFVLLGNLSRDPEIKYTNEGLAITDLRIAVNKRWRDKDGNENENVDFFNVTAWNRLAENCAGKLKKGDRVIISGRLNHRSFDTKDGKKINIMNIVADVVAPSLEFSLPDLSSENNALSESADSEVRLD
ncbi:MAG TPA: single-stranded DNA-binding protein [Actinobacteria bacterium]|jgi:single-strand DNA-binding protein|nr:single-stranded DNA-binding protein [Actinomycetota bacterium]